MPSPTDRIKEQIEIKKKSIGKDRPDFIEGMDFVFNLYQQEIRKCSEIVNGLKKTTNHE